MSNNTNFLNRNTSNLGSQIEKTKSNIQAVIRKTGQAFNKTANKALANTKRYQNNMNNAISHVVSNSTQEGNGVLYFLLGLLVIILIAVLILTFYYIMTDCPVKKSLTDYIWDPTSPCLNNGSPVTPSEPISGKPSDKSGLDLKIDIPGIRQVFNISNQDYTYDQAKCKCATYGARLATQSEVTDAFNRGGEWCSYGWSEGQQAFYPTQQETWEELQNDHKRKNDCGKPGVNGGFFANPNLKFGVNCYGIKPIGEVVIPKTPKDTPFCEKKNNFQASHILDTDRIAPFNPTRWSQ